MGLVRGHVHIIFYSGMIDFQPNARKEDLFGRPSQGLYSSSANSGKCLMEVTVDRNCLEVWIHSNICLFIIFLPLWVRDPCACRAKEVATFRVELNSV